MAKKFNFKLNPVLKIRHFREEAIKLELGRHVSELNAIKSRLQELDHHLSMGYQEIERLSTTSILAGQLRFYPMYFEGLRADIEKQKKRLLEKENEYQECLGRLAKAMGEVKVIEKLKEKEKGKFRKMLEKDQNMDIEERFAGQRHYQNVRANAKDEIV